MQSIADRQQKEEMGRLTAIRSSYQSTRLSSVKAFEIFGLEEGNLINGAKWFVSSLVCYGSANEKVQSEIATSNDSVPP